MWVVDSHDGTFGLYECQASKQYINSMNPDQEPCTPRLDVDGVPVLAGVPPGTWLLPAEARPATTSVGGCAAPQPGRRLLRRPEATRSRSCTTPTTSTDEQMRPFARWTNLSETTFLLAPTDAGADYRVRIFTRRGAAVRRAPTLGTAHAWLEAGGVPRTGTWSQECGVGLVRVRRGERLAFAGPPLPARGRSTTATSTRSSRSLRSTAPTSSTRLGRQRPGWVGGPAPRRGHGARAGARRAVGDLEVGVVGAHPAGRRVRVEVRAFVPSIGVVEDPVTGSLNAGLGSGWPATGSRRRTSRPGHGAGAGGRVHVEQDGETCGWAVTRSRASPGPSGSRLVTTSGRWSRVWARHARRGGRRQRGDRRRRRRSRGGSPRTSPTSSGSPWATRW